MSRGVGTSAAILAAAMLGSAGARAQARGPAAQEVQKDGQHIVEKRERSRQLSQQAQEEAEKERIELLDPAVRAGKFAELDAFLRRLTGRFRIEGKIEREMIIQIGPAEPLPNDPLPTVAPMADVIRTGDVTGIADCDAVGESAGLDCFISASWPTIDNSSWTPRVSIDNPLWKYFHPASTPSESLNAMRPAVLVLGLTTDPPRIHATIVTSETLGNDLTGKLTGASAKLLVSSPCDGAACFGSFEIIAEPDSDTISFIFKREVGQITLTLTMYRDPQAKLERPLKPLKAR